MIQEFRLPDLGENIEGGDVVQIHVGKGDKVEEEQILLEVETDKATIEVPSPFQGIVKDVHINAGQQAQVGQLILTIDSEGSSDARPAEKEESPKEKPAPEKSEPAQVESATKENKPGEAPSTAQPASPAKPSAPAAPVSDRPKMIAPASPTVRRFAREIGVDIHAVPGTGPGGRISSEDVKRYSRDLNSRRTQSSGAGVTIGQFAPPMPDFSKWGDVEKESMSNIRKSTAASMAQAWNTIPHVTQHDKADITELEKLRKSFASRAEEQGAKLTVTAILIKIAAAALKRFPNFNTSIDVGNNEIIFKKFYHIGVAVDTERGLLVPVVRNADRKNMIELAAEVGELAQKARNKKLSLEEMQGGTFTITNLGGIGGTSFTPIVNWPEVAILGVSRIQNEPTIVDDKLESRMMLPLSLSYDHRIIDGADAARFLRWICTALEQPFMIALEG